MNRKFTRLRGSLSRMTRRPRVTNVLHSRNETRRYDLLYVYHLHRTTSPPRRLVVPLPRLALLWVMLAGRLRVPPGPRYRHQWDDGLLLLWIDTWSGLLESSFFNTRKGTGSAAH
jgi:hypothetical protein